MKSFTSTVNRSSEICVAAQESLGHEAQTIKLVKEGAFYRTNKIGKVIPITVKQVKIKINKRKGGCPDTSVLDCRVGKPGSKERLNAYRSFYEQNEKNERSAFTVDLAEAIASGRQSRGKYDISTVNMMRSDRSDNTSFE